MPQNTLHKLLASVLFEFEDQPWLPTGLKHTITDMIELANTTLRGFNRYAADEVLRVARAFELTRVLELGAGSAPLAREIASRSGTEDIEIVPSDLRPHRESFAELADRYPGRVRPHYEPLDFSRDLQPDSKAVAVFLSTFHHLPEDIRLPVLSKLIDLGIPVIVLEALRPNLGSALGCLRAPGAALRLPLLMHDRPGNFRRLFWCWICPVLPFVFLWDAIVSVIRQWSAEEWEAAHAELGTERVGIYIEERSVAEQLVVLYPRERFASAASGLVPRAA